ncbi:AzlD domain-containing protein [Helcobacillus massiliensis]|uniref:Putative membrane protein n=1 Tax=Helcobacillus massiliensis TaxID=521392 RepID=A0A839QSI5_9MICO|nr:AzlD domain-containing protein [Helcobacillus massiliensis]MBB3021799.1 putative membrane protein [Helcobacillus massiliensis]MCT1557871.1 AzlD domain-containing protein [Helcobacillus massiliensis]MCT2037360.1 AzlD domain-containing protein [Helcobacillus massiliensis]MCT2332104.1 AzlD domain-containing protein [Helcobacillus massiliensis]
MSGGMLWAAVIAASLLSLGQKWLGYQIPASFLNRPRISRILSLMPIALLAALVATQTLTSGTSVVVDARIVGAAVAVVLLWRRAPFLLVIIAAAAATALTRLLGWG